MKCKTLIIWSALLLLGGLQGYAQQELSHYASGEEGIKCATMPGPGWYSRMYVDHYKATTLRDAGGDVIDIGFDLDITVFAPNIIWFPDFKFFGADYGMYMVLPVVRQELTIELAGIHETAHGLGDINFNPLLLSWHTPRSDIVATFSMYIPTGDYDPQNVVNPGYGYYTYMLSLGATCYSKDRAWSGAFISRYEFNSEKDGIDVKPGERFQFDWGVARNVAQLWEVGLAGFCSWQVADDTGADVVWDPSDHDRLFAIGPEVSYFHYPSTLNISLKHLVEFGGRDRPEGSATWLTLTKIM